MEITSVFFFSQRQIDLSNNAFAGRFGNEMSGEGGSRGRDDDDLELEQRALGVPSGRGRLGHEGGVAVTGWIFWFTFAHRGNRRRAVCGQRGQRSLLVAKTGTAGGRAVRGGVDGRQREGHRVMGGTLRGRTVGALGLPEPVAQLSPAQRVRTVLHGLLLCQQLLLLFFGQFSRLFRQRVTRHRRGLHVRRRFFQNTAIAAIAATSRTLGHVPQQELHAVRQVRAVARFGVRIAAPVLVLAEREVLPIRQIVLVHTSPVQLRHEQTFPAKLSLGRQRVQKAQLAATAPEAKVEPLVPRVAVQPQRVLQRHAKHLPVGQVQDATIVQEYPTLVDVVGPLEQILLAVNQLPIEQEQRVRVVPQVRRHPDGVRLQEEPRAVHVDRRALEVLEAGLDARQVLAVAFA